MHKNESDARTSKQISIKSNAFLVKWFVFCLSLSYKCRMFNRNNALKKPLEATKILSKR